MASGKLMKFRNLVCLIAVLAITGSSTIATIVSVGSGVNTAGVYIEWSDGFWTEFEVNFGQNETDTITGLGLLQELNSADSIDFTLTTEDWGWGIAIEGIEYVDGGVSHYNPGWVEGEDWWHYWNKDAGAADWAFASVGGDARIVSDGDMDGWIYGRAGAPTSDFAVEVIEYVEGSGVGSDWLSGEPFNDPNSALGRPTLETSGDGFFIPVDESVPVVPVYPPFRTFELVTIGNDGQLTVKFSHPVANDENNPYGIDFIIYGNAYQIIGGGQGWTNGNPEETIVSGSVAAEPGIVSVSQDGENWYYFSSGPYADSFAPTASYEWDDVNDVWADELDPTRPVDPNLSVAGMTVAQMITAYDGSAGGTGFDIGVLGLEWIQYVRIQDDPNSNATTEIDAIADVSCCGDYKHPYPVGDLNQDCKVDYDDFGILIQYWLVEISGPNDPAVIADINEDGIVNIDDWILIFDNWMECTWDCE
ncbi:MAG: dockerin type I domain-containing protein [Planctomycetota bacterium]